MLAAQLFGRGFAELAPILGMTTQQFNEATKWAHDYGTVMSEEAVWAAAAFDDRLGELKLALAGVGREIGSSAIPTLTKWTQLALKSWPKIKQAVADFWAEVKPMWVEFGQTLRNLMPVFKELATILLGGLVVAFRAMTLVMKVAKHAATGLSVVLAPLLKAIKPLVMPLEEASLAPKSSGKKKAGKKTAPSVMTSGGPVVSPQAVEEAQAITQATDAAQRQMASMQRADRKSVV